MAPVLGPGNPQQNAGHLVCNRLKKEIEMAEQVGERIFGQRGFVQFDLLRVDERVNSLRSWLRWARK